MKESRGRGGEERRKSGPFVGARQRRQSPSADKMKKNTKKKPQLVLVQHWRSIWPRVCGVYVRNREASQDIR